jgi:hypothetical protein
MTKQTYSIIGYAKKDHKWIFDAALRAFPEELLPIGPVDKEFDGIILTEAETAKLLTYAIGVNSKPDHEENIYVLEHTDDLGTMLALGHALNH